MRKRLLSVFLSLCMTLTMVPVAFAAQVSPPTGLEWCKIKSTIDYVTSERPNEPVPVNIFPWDVVWNRVADGSNEYDIKIYKDGTLVDKSKWSFSATDISKQLSADLFRALPRESGTYTFTVQALGDGQNLTDSEIATSEALEYTAPSAQLGVATNLRWDGSIARWDVVPSADAYAIDWYFSKTAGGQFEFATSISGVEENYIELDDYAVVENGEGYYAFEIRALSNDVNSIRPGELSARSDVYNTDSAITDINTSLDNILAGLGDQAGSDAIDDAVSQVKALDSEDLRIAMEADRSDKGVNSKIDAIENKTGITLETKVASGFGIDSNKISMTGARLNANDNTKTVTFNISKPAQDAVVPGTYENAVQFDFALDGAAPESSAKFAVPIKITMPIPPNIVPEKLHILHYGSDGTVGEILLPYVFQNADGEWYASFVVTHFSTFVFANVGTAATIGNIYYDTLQGAIDAAQSGATISLYRNHDDTEVRVAGKSLNINCGVYTLNPDVVVVGTDCTKTVTGTNGTDQVVRIIYQPSSASGGGSSSSNKPTASVSGSGGKVTVASNGIVTITPDRGYQISKITVNGKEVNIPANGKLTGLGKDDKVVVTFEKIPEEKPDTSTTPFTDVAKNAWYADAVQYVYENGIMDGTSAASFSPNATTTRGMIVTMLHRLEDTPPAASSGFTDVAVGAWYADAVAWAAKNGVVNGVSAASFAPNTAITREQLAAILYRYAQLKGYSVSVSGNLSGYADASQISEYAVTAMQWANAAGLITGNTANTLNPRGHATRAEVATILMRFIEKMG